MRNIELIDAYAIHIFATLRDAFPLPRHRFGGLGQGSPHQGGEVPAAMVLVPVRESCIPEICHDPRPQYQGASSTVS